MEYGRRDRLVLLLTSSFVRRAGQFALIPSPSDEPMVTHPGADPDRILLVGSGIVIGTGVSSYQLGLAGHLARLVASGTGRGVKIDVAPRPGLTVASVKSGLSGIDLSRYDAIVLAVGLNDALLLRRPSSWRKSLREAVVYIQQHMSQETALFILRIVDPSETPLFRPLPALLAARSARRLNSESEIVARESNRLSLLTFRFSAADFGPEGYDTHAYGRWAAELSPEIIRTLVTAHQRQSEGLTDSATPLT